MTSIKQVWMDCTTSPTGWHKQAHVTPNSSKTVCGPAPLTSWAAAGCIIPLFWLVSFLEHYYLDGRLKTWLTRGRKETLLVQLWLFFFFFRVCVVKFNLVLNNGEQRPHFGILGVSGLYYFSVLNVWWENILLVILCSILSISANFISEPKVFNDLYAVYFSTARNAQVEIKARVEDRKKWSSLLNSK